MTVICFEQKNSYPVQQYAGRRWKFDWVTPKKPGQYTLLSRARDANDNVQPDKHDENYTTYVIDHVHQLNYRLAIPYRNLHLKFNENEVKR